MRRLALVAAAVLLGATLAPPAAVAALPKPQPKGIYMGGLHLTPSSGTGSIVPSFTADHACRPGTRVANVGTIDMQNVEQVLSKNVTDEANQAKGFGAPFMTDMNTVQAAAGTPETAEQFLLLVDCRAGVNHGTYTDAVIVEFDASGNWSVVASPAPTDDSSSSSTPIVLAGIAVALIGSGAGLWYVMRRRRSKPVALAGTARNQKGQRTRS